MREQKINSRTISIPIALICFLAWPALAPVLAIVPYGNVPVLILFVLTLMAVASQSKSHSGRFLLASLLGIVLEAFLETTSLYSGETVTPLRGDDDGLWSLYFPFTIAVWGVGFGLGFVLKKIAQYITQSRLKKV